MIDRTRLTAAIFAVTMCSFPAFHSAAADGLNVVSVEHREGGETAYRVTSPWQRGETVIRVLLPDRIAPDEHLRVLYVLPVEAGEGTRWGDGLKEVRQSGLHNVHRLICVMPTFSHLPWYADHPTDATIRQEKYLLEGVIPWADESLPAITSQNGRMLVGFSKSGWGAFSLLLRHPAVFDKALAWDAPLMMDAAGKYGSGPIFGTQENFAAYQLSTLARQRAEQFRIDGRPRLFHVGFGNFRNEHVRFEKLLIELQIPHVYQDGPQLRHHWETGWLPDAIDLLARQSRSAEAR
ncbi:MAG: alpha/beta hydrolase-fold protein [Planctomycetota bacterium]|jgi:S-formylglutathione hydrolase FrmB